MEIEEEKSITREYLTLIQEKENFIKRVLTLSDEDFLNVLEFYAFLGQEESLKEKLSQTSNSIKSSLYIPSGQKKKGWEGEILILAYRFPTLLKTPQFNWLLEEFTLLLKTFRMFGYSFNKLIREYAADYSPEKFMNYLVTYHHVKTLQSHTVNKDTWTPREVKISQEKAIVELAKTRILTKDASRASRIRNIKRHLSKAKRLIRLLGISEHKPELLPEKTEGYPYIETDEMEQRKI